MAKNVPYHLGDVFKLPLAEGISGIGRILIIQSPALLVGFYRLVVKHDDTVDVESLKNQEYLIKIKCGDPGLKKKEWKIIGNIPLEGKVLLPLFWDREPLTKELYLRKYNATESDPLGLGPGFKDRPTTEEEIKKEGAQPDGLAGWKAAEMKLKYYLEMAGAL